MHSLTGPHGSVRALSAQLRLSAAVSAPLPEAHLAPCHPHQLQITWSKNVTEPLFIGYRTKTANTPDVMVRPHVAPCCSVSLAAPTRARAACLPACLPVLHVHRRHPTLHWRY